MERFQKLPNLRNNPLYRDRELAEAAVQLATDHPALAEQVLQLQQAVGLDDLKFLYVMRLCRRLARVDPERARRLAASRSGPGARACAWAFVAFGLAEKRDRSGATAALDRAIAEIDRVRVGGPGADRVAIVNGIEMMYPTNPAAVILPAVERFAPDRLSDVFWRAVALDPRVETEREDKIAISNIGHECIVLARYDREVAATLFEPMDAYLRSLAPGPDLRITSLIAAKACIDPRAAVAVVEALAPVHRPERPHNMRLWLAETLGLSSEKRWARLWRYMGAQVDD